MIEPVTQDSKPKEFKLKAMDIILIEVVLIFALFKVSSIFPINAVSTIQHPERFY